MQSALERRQALFELMCERRHEKIDNLAFEFGVDRRTIRKDIALLSLSRPIYTTRGTGGGVHIVDGYDPNKFYLPERHAITFENMKQRLKGEELDAVEYILKKYKKPERRGK